jgi:RHS repeat-associated protein
VPTYGYTGREPDASGLVYYRARYYDPSVGRFTQRDPVGYLDGLNRYAYVGNNPVNFTDPNGLLARQVGAWWETQEASYHLSNRIAGGFRAVGGGAEAFLGGAACTSGVGCLVGVPVAVHGTDQFQAGLRQLWTGQDIDSFTSQGLQTAGLSRNTANLVDAGIGIAGSLGSGAIANSTRAASVVDDVAKGAGNAANNAADGLRLNKSLASQSQMSESGTIMAGSGGRVAFRDAQRVAEQYGGNASDWVKKTSSSYTARDGTQFETHWVENIKTGQRVEFKTKFPGGE